MNQSKSIYSATKASKKATSDNAIVRSKPALSFQIGGWLTEEICCWIIHKGMINARLSVDLSYDRPWWEKAVGGKGYTEYSEEKKEMQNHISRITLSDFILAKLDIKIPARAHSFV